MLESLVKMTSVGVEDTGIITTVSHFSSNLVAKHLNNMKDLKGRKEFDTNSG